jgi:hypothetical protein
MPGQCLSCTPRRRFHQPVDQILSSRPHKYSGIGNLKLAAAQLAEAAAREAALKAEQEARDAEFAEQAAREAALEAERQAARDARYAARKARKRKGR